jgi:MFS family permease
MFIIGRALAGTGGAGLILGLLIIMAASAPLDKRPSNISIPFPYHTSLLQPLTTASLAPGYLGIMMGFASLGLVCGPIFGGLLTQKVSWRWCFYINIPVGVVTGTLLAFLKIPDSKQVGADLATCKQRIKRLDLPGFALFTPSIIMLLLALDWGGVSYHWNSSTIIGLFCGAGAAWIAFLLWERRQGEGVSASFHTPNCPSLIVCHEIPE